ncbi:metallophosphoesterase [Phenylobacterium sp.]|uniref:metallophosphoesterase family protein n=1 Tax=Phenylobacterium sp. TaxID=1871053 RepID=UPI0012124A62|nr:metallophosphoesterase [Phenylobacterium sp.]THD59287.1 MAG: metallophosphoesterase [Phenylobacterium sp.]
MLTWAHFGDLHVSEEDVWRSLAALRTLVSEANRRLDDDIDFVFLPGDNANHGTVEQYARIAAVLAELKPQVFLIPGDHDFEPKSLGPFYEGLGAQRLPLSVLIAGRRCLFLDIVSSGSGGPDFRLGASQTDWLAHELDLADSDPNRPVVFMHAFPGDLAEGGEALARLLADHRVACIDTGHTHYNELLNDGGAIYTATRSTGQIEEGPMGFSLHAVDGSVVSWRFKPLGTPWPLVMITTPSDRRLVTDPADCDHVPRGAFAVRAKMFGGAAESVALAVDGGFPVIMAPVVGEPGLWTATAGPLADGRHEIIVTARSGGEAHRDAIEIETRAATAPPERRLKPRGGDHVHTIGAWPQRGLLGTQLGPNKNGKIKW